jgi:predicted NUDIX family NTP pyrophosphohydrolase
VVDPQGGVPARRGCPRGGAEEIGQPPPDGELIDLGAIRQRSGKLVQAWAVAGDLDVSEVRSTTITIAWPPRSGRRLEVPEVDRADWFTVADARERLNPAQVPFLSRLVHALEDGGG